MMPKAKKAMRDTLAGCSLADIGQSVGRKVPDGFAVEVSDWFEARLSTRGRRGLNNREKRGISLAQHHDSR